jgi:hypothetical protein
MAGRDTTLNAMKSLDTYVQETELDADYGKFKYLVEVENYSPDDARRIIAEGKNNG